MGALMERNMRDQIFAHLQAQPFSFFDEHKVGELMTRVSNDTNNLSELYHHGPEDIVITLVKPVGTFVILMSINTLLTAIIFACLPLMIGYAFYFNGKMPIALGEARDRIGDVSARVEDSLARIRVAMSFTKARFEQQRFAIENQRFLQSRRSGYKSEAYRYGGFLAFTQLFTIIVIAVGGSLTIGGPLQIADVVTFLLYVGLLVEPIRTALNVTRFYQGGITGFDRVMELLDIEPSITDNSNALILDTVEGNIELNAISFRYNHHTL